MRIIRLPCTGRIDFNLIIKAFEIGADSVLVSGCHPGDCHYTSGNYHARRRWILFRELLQTLGFDLERIHFTWISAAEGHKWQEIVKEITEKTRKLGPYKDLYQISGSGDVPLRPSPPPWTGVDAPGSSPAPARGIGATALSAWGGGARERCARPAAACWLRAT